MANLEKEELIVRLNESNKKDEFLRNQISSQDENVGNMHIRSGKLNGSTSFFNL